MKFESKKGVFLESLQLAFSAIPNKTTLQILNNFLFNVVGNTLEVTSTDLDLTINLNIEVEGHEDGSIVVNARKFLEVIKELPDLPVHISVDNQLVTIKSETGFQCNMTGFDASEYPALPNEERSKTFSLSIKAVKNLFNKTSFAVSTDFSTRLSLTGVYFEKQGDNLLMVGTDGHRLGKCWVENAAASFSKGIILPSKAVGQVIKMIHDPEASVDIEIGEATAKFKNKSVTIYSKLIEGPYPDYEKVIPLELNKKAVVNREELISVLKRVATMAHSKTKQVKFTFEKESLFLSARNVDLGGESEESLPLKFSGKSTSIGFNGVYFLEVLRLIDTEEVSIEFSSSLGATVIKPEKDNADYFFIVMPLRLLEED